MTSKTIVRHFPTELREQPEALLRTAAYLEGAVGEELRKTLGSVSRLVWTGSGDCYFVGAAICSFFETYAQIPAVAVEAYDFVQATPAVDEDTLVVGFSSSGKSVYTVAALTLARSRGARTLAISNIADSPLAGAAEFALQSQAGRSFTFPTKTTTSALLIALELARIAGDVRGTDAATSDVSASDIAATVARALELSTEGALSVAGRLNGARRVVVVGSGLSRTAAMIGAAKLIETSDVVASANNCEEYLHLVGFGVREVDVVVVVDDGNLRSRLAAEYAVQQGATTVVVTPFGPDSVPEGAHEVRFADSGDPVGRLFAGIAALHVLAAEVSANRGTNPDIPADVDLDYVIGLLYTEPVDGWNVKAAQGVRDVAS